MSTPHVVTQLLLKKAEVEAQIDSLTDRLAEAKADLIHVVGAVRLFDPTAAAVGPVTAYHGLTKALKRSDMFALCKAAMDASTKPLSTRELARHVITSQGWDHDDRRLALTMTHKVGTMMARFDRRGIVDKAGLRDGASLWRLAVGR
ncbi:hypothetical protein [Lichenibacterium ramalinae]|uniref:Uncharacterized protein n=1 Tax=Lichenibacterium ramalinae TaxID=2316527 RepID=A0A4Q2RE65_9HYPH|nr:hypothetical protein [Lichenibacterium ramalinae]RYB03627.1 hypothetical protein D3272_15870 [Lichenibacterium ramalinae]